MANRPHRAHVYRAPPAGYIMHLRPDKGGARPQGEAASSQNESCWGHHSPYALLDDIWHGGESSIDEVEDAASAWKHRECRLTLRRQPAKAETKDQAMLWSQMEDSEAQSVDDQRTVEAILRKCQRAQANLKLIQPSMHAPKLTGETKNLSQVQSSREMLPHSEEPQQSSAFDRSPIDAAEVGPSSDSKRSHGDLSASGSHNRCCRQQQSKQACERSANDSDRFFHGNLEATNNCFENQAVNGSVETISAADETTTSRIHVHRRTSHLVTRTRGSLSDPCTCKTRISSEPKGMEKAATNQTGASKDGYKHDSPPKFLNLKSRLPTVRLVRPGLAGKWGAQRDRLSSKHPAAESSRSAGTAPSAIETGGKTEKGRHPQRLGRRDAAESSIAERDTKNPLIQALAISLSLAVQTAKFTSPVWSVLIKAFAAFGASISQDIKLNNPIDLVCWTALCLFCLCLASCVLKALGLLFKQCWDFVMSMFLPVRLLRRLLF